MAEYVNKEEVLKHCEALPKLYREAMRLFIKEIPSVDIVYCEECKWEWTQKCPPHRMGLIHDASDYCSYGIRKTECVDKHDSKESE